MKEGIKTTYRGPTSGHGARVRASTGVNTHVLHVAWDYELEPSEMHERAAKALAERLGWKIGGGGHFGPGEMFWFQL